MYKLTATLPTGNQWICTSTQTTDLQRIAANLRAVSYVITKHGTIIYVQEAV